MRIETEGPWGKFEYEEGEHEKVIEMGAKQLAYFAKRGNTSDYLKRDLEGYQKILNSSNPRKNADSFLKAKHEGLRSGKPFEDNQTIITHLIEMDQWID